MPRRPQNPRLVPVGMAVMMALVVSARAATADTEPLRVRAQVKSGVYLVGQAIELSVSLVAGRERPVIATPQVKGADITRIGDDPLKPISASGIGDLVFERNLYRTRFRLIARRPGMLTIPPVSARLDDQSGASAPLTLNIRPLPVAGRTAEFLGGVGAFEVEATAQPTSIRLGQTLEYRVMVRGPAAWGITDPPSLARIRRLPLGIEIETGPDVAVADPPSHVFVSRLRPTRAGEATLPPIAIAAFDPTADRYVTRVTAGIAVRVADVPRFDPDSLGSRVPDQPPVAKTGSGHDWRLGLACMLGVVAGILIYGLRRRRSALGYRHLCDDALARLTKAGSEAEAGRIVIEGLIGYLAATIGRAPGALTPIEAEAGVARASGSSDLATRASRLVALSDRALYGGPSVNVPGLNLHGLRLFRDLAATRPVETH